MYLTLKICLVLHVILSASAISVKDLNKLQQYDVRHSQKYMQLFHKTIREQISGEAKVCKIFKDFLANQTDPETLENHADWLIGMVDSWGKIPSGILEGNVNDMGQYDECMAIEGKNIDVSGQYCEKGIILFQKIAIALCIPSDCELLPLEGVSDIQINPGYCQTIDYGSEFTTGDIIVATIFGIILALMVLSTCYDCFLHYTEQQTRSQLLIAFSAWTNTKKLFATNSASGQVTCLNGIRTISLMWIISGHSFALQAAYPTVNMVSALQFQFGKKSQYIQAGHFSVDTFFFLSAFLLSYNYIKNVHRAITTAEKKSEKPQNPLTLSKVPMFYVHRILRILPPLAAFYGLGNTLIAHIAQGPLDPFLKTIMPNACYDHWWSFFLFIQNYVHYENMCLLTTWYLSADMQMFLASPLIIIPIGELILRGKKRIAYIFAGVVVIACIVIPMIPDILQEDDPTILLNEYATHPRLSIYTLGILFGMIVIDCLNKKIRINHVLNVLLWAVSLGVLLTIVLTNMDATIIDRTIVKMTLFFTFARPAWALALCWIVFSCHFGYGGPINWLLSKSIHQIMTRLSFSMYLLHMLVQGRILSYTRTAMHFSEYEIIYRWCGDYIFTIVFSIIWVLAFESPVMILEKLIFGGGKKSESSGKTQGVENKTVAQQA